jgi:hypothetical protein
MLGDRLSLAASSLASEEREDIGSLVRQYQRTMGRAFSTVTSPPGSPSTERVRTHHEWLSNRERKSIQSLGHGQRGLCS